MTLKRKLVLFLTVFAMAALTAPAVQGANDQKPCSSSDDPSAGWTTDGTQKGSCKSSHDLEDESVSNPGGQKPPGKQP